MTNTEFQGRVLALCKEYGMFPTGKTVLCAVSGGVDSMVLLHLLETLREGLDITLWAAHYNHKLRGAESERDAAFVADYCAAHQIPLLCEEGDVGAEARRRGLGVEETGRSMRYAFLEDAARQAGAARIVTAHHADDNVETLLLRLIRGTGLRGLSGIPPVRGMIVRPLLTTTRQEIETFAAEHGVPFVEDSSNHDVHFARNRLRHALIPLMEEMNPNLIPLVSETIRSLREDQVYLEARALELFHLAHPAEDGMVIPVKHIAMAPRALAVRVLQRILEEIEAPAASGVHLGQIIAIAQGENPSAALNLPGGILVQRIYGDLLIAWDHLNEPLPPLEEMTLCLNGVTELLEGAVRVSCWETVCPQGAEQSGSRCYLSADSMQGTPILRARRMGDNLALPGRRDKTLKKLMIEEKIPRRLRERIPVLADEAGLLAVAGIGPARSRLAKPGEPAYELNFEYKESGSEGNV